MSLSATLEMSSRHFYWMYSQIDRVEAHEDLRMIRVMAAANTDQESFSKVLSSMVEQMGEVEVFETVTPAAEQRDWNENELDPDFDREGLRRLKARHNG